MAWEEFAKQLIKDEIKRNLSSYAELAETLGENVGTIRNKINRGSFGAPFLLEALTALGVSQLDLAEHLERFKAKSQVKEQ